MDIVGRISFDDELQIMQVDFSNITFKDSAQVNAIYDQIADRIRTTGRKWYFLVNYHNCQVYMEALLTWQNRGKKMNEQYSLGSVRYQASEGTGDELIRRSMHDPYYANLVDTYDQAMARIGELKQLRRQEQEFEESREEERAKAREWEQLVASKSVPVHVFENRVHFHDDMLTMEADFSDFSFLNYYVVDAFYDYIEDRLRATGNKWYFLVNYRNCRVDPNAWFEYARRGKALNLEFSLGSVRYDASPKTAAEIQRRSNSEAFDPNLFADRDSAVARIVEMRGQAKAA